MSPTPDPVAEVLDSGAGGPPRFSVVVPIYNRSRELYRLLHALAHQSFPRERFEVIVCDDASDEELCPIVEKASARHGLRIVYLRQEGGGPGAARNLGLAHARGEIVVFTDSDCVPDAAWLVAFDCAFADPATRLTGGRIDYRGAHHLSARCVNFLMSSTIGAAGARDPRGPIAMDFYPRSGNLAVRLDMAIGVGGFPGHSCGEDLEFSHRIIHRYGPPRFVSEASVLHDERSNVTELFHEAARKGATRIRLWRTCRMHQPLHTLPTALVLVLLGSAVAALLWPASRAFAAVPWAIYFAVLAVLGVQGAVDLGEFRPLAAIPFYAALMHLGYGLGYLAAAVSPGCERDEERLSDWDRLRRDILPIIFDQRSTLVPVRLDDAK